MSKAEDELLAMMNDSPRFVVVYGIPGCGKTTTILSAAKRRGKAVLYYSVGAAGSLKLLEEQIQKEYGTMLRRTSGATVWDRLTVAGNVWSRWSRWLRPDASTPLVIILDDANELQERDLHRIANVRDGTSFSVWLVTSEEQGLRMLAGRSDVLTRAKGYTLPSIPEEELVRFVDSALGSHGKITRDLAERYVSLVGCSLALLWQLVESTKKQTLEWDVMPQLFLHLPKDFQPKDFHLEVRDVPSTVDWSCLQPQRGVVKVRRDLISFGVAQAEVSAAEREVSAAEDNLSAAKREVWWWKMVVAEKPEVARQKDAVSAVEEALEDVKGAGALLTKALKKQEEARMPLQEALGKQKDARVLRDKAAKLISKNNEADRHALSTYYKSMAVQKFHHLFRQQVRHPSSANKGPPPLPRSPPTEKSTSTSTM